MDERKERCETCRFWFGAWKPENHNEKEGQCRRYPPIRCLNEDNDFALACEWDNPVVDETHWCGEWQAKETEQHAARPVYVADIMATFTKYCGARHLLRKLSKEIPIAADVQRSDVDRIGAKQWSKVRDQAWQAIQAAVGKQ